MPDATIKAALKEAYSLARSNEIYLDTIELSHPDITDPIYLVKDRIDRVCMLEGPVGPITFTACAFQLTLPASGQDGLQDLNISIDNVKPQGSTVMSPVEFVKTVKNSRTKVTVTFRPYLATDLSQPQMDPPLSLALSDVQVKSGQVTGRCSFADIVNMSFGTELYIRSRFPSL